MPLLNDKMTFEDIWDATRSTVVVAWSKTTRRMRAVGGIVVFFILSALLLRPSMPHRSSFPALPKVTLDYGGPVRPPRPQFNASKVALIIENRPDPILAPLVLHYMSVVPPDWRFRLIGSTESVALINSSRAIREQVESGKLDLTYIPANMSTSSQEEISRFLTTLWIYETVLQPAEWLLVFQTDSMLCANSRQTLNDWLEYDWVGAPWNPNGRFGGNGGLSLRRVSAIIDVLRNQVRTQNSEPEDVWLTDRLGHRPGAKLANGTASLVFSGENLTGELERVGKKKGKGKDNSKAGELVKGVDDWREGHYEPMGYHTGGGRALPTGLWGKPEQRKHIWNYCPEIKLTLQMDPVKFVPGDCNANWKRWDNGQEGVDGVDDSMEIIDGVAYPRLPAGLVPW
ncbi:hypothetical protein DSL72_008468 [Monilinia vaccinii-corymbosi]|uniref:DUF5672 domain-containing protein n=1 Tax=Monilinia vaccinii-corymbosi TaxID=61207 RepID=A0A8A3PJV3_9HELO|nr:hypothetical protein DSL72_008468 [Monilinia vaccinii-corymbosi]